MHCASILVNTLASLTVLVLRQPAGVYFGRFRMSLKMDRAFDADLGALDEELLGVFE